MRHLPTLALICAATGAVADIETATTEHILPATEAFAEAASGLESTAQQDCTADSVRPAWNETFDAWLGLAHLRFGPLEEDSRALTIAFWPDTRGMIPRTLDSLIEDEDAAASDPEVFSDVSIAARGLFGMEQVLYDETRGDYGSGDYTCTLVQAQATDLASLAAAIDEDWQSFADVVRSAGEPGNEMFLSEREPRQAFYTALTTGLEFNAEQRLGRPLGTFDDPRPNRAEARRADRSLRNVVLSLEALRDFARALAPADIPRTDSAFEQALETAGRIESPALSAVDDPLQRIEIEALQQQIRDIGNAAADEIGVALGVSSGFNATDGD